LGLRDARWSEAIAVGSLAFVERVKTDLGIKAMHREFEPLGGGYALREPGEAYGGELDSESDVLRLENTISWDENAEAAATWRGPTRDNPGANISSRREKR
jgi:hypothetical protein